QLSQIFTFPSRPASYISILLFFFNATATTEIYTLSLHDALPICARRGPLRPREDQAPHPRVPRGEEAQPERQEPDPVLRRAAWGDRKSTRLNSSHVSISYAVFCLKKKKKNKSRQQLYLVQQLSKI